MPRLARPDTLATELASHLPRAFANQIIDLKTSKGVTGCSIASTRARMFRARAKHWRAQTVMSQLRQTGPFAAIIVLVLAINDSGEALVQACRSKIELVTRTIGAVRGRAARGRP